MPLLSMDKNGNIYQAAAHRPDGKGMESIPTLSGGGDVALENPYQQAEYKRQKYNKLLEAHNAQDKLIEQTQKRQMGAYRQAKKKQAVINETIHRNPANQQALLHEAVLQGLHGADFDMLALSGFGKTSDGRRGKSSQQRALESAILQGMGHTPQLGEQGLVFELDPYEKEQYELSIAAEQVKKQNIENQIAVQESTQTAQAPATQAASLPPLLAPASQPAIEETVKSAVSSTGGLFSDPKVKLAAAAGILYLVMRK